MGELRTALSQVLSQHLTDFIQKPGSAGVLVYAVCMGKAALESQKELIEGSFRDGKMAYKPVSYEVLETNEPRGPAKSTVFIDPRGGALCIYVEDKIVREIKGSASRKGASSLAESSKAPSK